MNRLSTIPILSIFFISSIIAAELYLDVSGFQPVQGDAIVAIYHDADGFPENVSKAFYLHSMTIEDDSLMIHLPDLELAPELAIMVIHDEDSNGDLNHNFRGFPSEGVGMAWPKGIVVNSKPTYDKVKISPSTGDTLKVVVKHLSR